MFFVAAYQRFGLVGRIKRTLRIEWWQGCCSPKPEQNNKSNKIKMGRPLRSVIATRTAAQPLLTDEQGRGGRGVHLLH